MAISKRFCLIVVLSMAAYYLLMSKAIGTKYVGPQAVADRSVRKAGNIDEDEEYVMVDGYEYDKSEDDDDDYVEEQEYINEQNKEINPENLDSIGDANKIVVVNGAVQDQKPGMDQEKPVNNAQANQQPNANEEKPANNPQVQVNQQPNANQEKPANAQVQVNQQPIANQEKPANDPQVNQQQQPNGNQGQPPANNPQVIQQQPNGQPANQGQGNQGQPAEQQPNGNQQQPANNVPSDDRPVINLNTNMKDVKVVVNPVPAQGTIQ